MKKQTVIFSGDYHVYGRFNGFIKKHFNHNVFCEGITGLVQSSKLSVFNLEDPITNNQKGILKYGPHGVGSEESLLPIKQAGFNLATFATNHTYDMGNQGIADTIEVCSNHGLDIVGAGLTKEVARRPYFGEIGNIKICILNFSRIEYNAVSDDHGGANPLDVIDNTKDIIDAKLNADYVFVVVHEGVDVFHLPYPKLVKQMRFYADNGADAIILHHSRIISGYEIYNNTPIFYGLGNLLHLTKNRDEHIGIMLKFIIESSKPVGFEILPVELDPNNVIVSLCEGRLKQQVLKKVYMLSEIIKDDKKLMEEWKKHVLSKRALYLSIIAGHTRIIYRVAKKIKWLKLYEKFLTCPTKKHLARWNIIKCQAHREAVNLIYKDILKM